ncbi:MAG: heavy-metal-associated domain-containing protein [Polyangiales bacterium]
MKAKLRVEGMSCGACVQHVKKAVAALPSVTDAVVVIGKVELEYDPAKLSVADIATAITDAGYDAHPDS